MVSASAPPSDCTRPSIVNAPADLTLAPEATVIALVTLMALPASESPIETKPPPELVDSAETTPMASVRIATVPPSMTALASTLSVTVGVKAESA